MSDITPENETPVVIDYDPVIIYQFEMPFDLCGMLIGKEGFFVRTIKQQTNARVVVNRHPTTSMVKIVSVEGTRSEVRNALYMIRDRFPPTDYPQVSMQQINAISPLGCQITPLRSCQLSIPDGVSCEVTLSCLVNPSHIFVQQPTHPTYPSLSSLFQFMSMVYGANATPPIYQPQVSAICVVPISEGSCQGWYRAMITDVAEDGSDVEVKFVDYGGYMRVPADTLRQIRCDFMGLPFQATECYLAGIAPANEETGWTSESNISFNELAQGLMLQAKIIYYAEDGVPCIKLNRVQSSTNICINKEMVAKGFAKEIDSLD